MDATDTPTETAFEVVLEIRAGTTPIGSTRDVFDAADAADAERKAIEAWNALEPACKYVPLLTVATSRSSGLRP